MSQSHSSLGSSHQDRPHSDGGHHHDPINPVGALGVIIGVAVCGAVVYYLLSSFPGLEKQFSLQTTDVYMIFLWSLLFIFVWQGLGRMLFAPYLKLQDARDAATIGAEKSADDLIAKAQALTSDYENQTRAARIAAMERKIQELNAAKKEASKVIETAEGEAQEIVRKIRWELATNMEKLRADALREAEQLATILADKVRSPVA